MRIRPSAAVLLAAALVLAGCGSTQWAGSASVGGSVTAPVAPIAPAAAAAGGGTTIITGPQGGYVSVNVSGSVANFVYWMTGVGIYAAMLMDDYQYNGGQPLLSRPMRENRTVEEVDCTRPIPEELIGNIKCR